MTKATCRAIAVTASLALLAACGAPSPGADANMRNGAYKTKGGVPWVVTTSGARPMSEASAMRASAEANVNLTSRGAVNVATNDAKSVFRIITIDGHTFATIGKMRTPGSSKSAIQERQRAIGLLFKGIRVAGCRHRGDDYGILSENSGNTIVAASTGADC